MRSAIAAQILGWCSLRCTAWIQRRCGLDDGEYHPPALFYSGATLLSFEGGKKKLTVASASASRLRDNTRRVYGSLNH